MKTKNSAPLALCGITTALSLFLLLLTAIPVADLALPALAGTLLMPIVVELGRRYAFGVYAAVGLLALLLVPSLEAKFLYIGFFGFYPILKELSERLPSRLAEWCLKLLFFNAAILLSYFLMTRFFSLDVTAFSVGGISLPWLFLLLFNAVFVLYDVGLTRLISAYVAYWGPHLRRLFRF